MITLTFDQFRSYVASGRAAQWNDISGGDLNKITDYIVRRIDGVGALSGYTGNIADKVNSTDIQEAIWNVSNNGATTVTGAPDYSSNWMILVDKNEWELGKTAADLRTGDKTLGKQSFMVQVSTVPEPSTYALMAAGLAALGFVARRRRAS